ncbi:hypothetical protein LCGC14_3019170 [marine sediment metagenome]|uniref:Uncharacterized protein n=1 Tax=marine sediment metagenome TaxID=412755 RepID=A0A0F8ZLZ6_9ZZZZ
MARIIEIAVLTKQDPMHSNNNLSALCPYDSGSSEEDNWFEQVLAGLLYNRRAGKFKMLLNASGSEYVVVDKPMIRTITVTLNAAHLINYDGGEHAPVVGEVVYVNGAETTEYATVKDFTLASGTWGGNDAAGVLEVHKATNAFAANLENNDIIEDSGGTTICDVVGSIAR